jgi:hypothetical protein
VRAGLLPFRSEDETVLGREGGYLPDLFRCQRRGFFARTGRGADAGEVFVHPARGEEEENPGGVSSDVAEAVPDAVGYVHEFAGAGLELLLAGQEGESPGKNVERLVQFLVDVRRRPPAGGSRSSSCWW